MATPSRSSVVYDSRERREVTEGVDPRGAASRQAPGGRSGRTRGLRDPGHPAAAHTQSHQVVQVLGRRWCSGRGGQRVVRGSRPRGAVGRWRSGATGEVLGISDGLRRHVMEYDAIDVREHRMVDVVDPSSDAPVAIELSAGDPADEVVFWQWLDDDQFVVWANGDLLACQVSAGSCRSVVDGNWVIGRRDVPLMPGDEGIGGDWALGEPTRADRRTWPRARRGSVPGLRRTRCRTGRRRAARPCWRRWWSATRALSPRRPRPGGRR